MLLVGLPDKPISCRRALSKSRPLYCDPVGYDDNGNHTSITPRGRSAHVFSHSPVDLTEEYRPPPTATGDTPTRYEYDLERRLTRIMRPDGSALQFAYDAAGRASTVAFPRGEITYQYDPVSGRLDPSPARSVR